MERMAYDQLYGYLVTNKILVKEQYGFRDKRSTDAALIHITDKMLASIDEGKVSGAAFLDLSKAFDTVDTKNCSKNCLVLVYQIIQSVGYCPI